MLSWRSFNTLSYRFYSALSHRRTALRLDLTRPAAAGGRRRLVHLNWGLIGDTILSTATLRQYRQAFPEHEIVCVAREPVRWLLSPHVDRFVPFAPDEPDLGDGFVGAVRSGALDGCDLLTGDVHLFYGGLACFSDLITRLPARVKVVYEGYASRRQLAPWRRFPAGVRVIPSLEKRGEPHVLHDALHFVRALIAAAGGRFEVADLEPVVPVPDAGPVLARFALEERGYVACHVTSNNPKKDWPLESWERLIATRPETRFVALGAAKDHERVAHIRAPNLANLCGQTSLPESIALTARAGGFCGIDSGLAHVAANVGVRTLVIAQNSTLGWFFPYPRSHARPNLTTLHNEDSPSCVGCFFACPREPLWEMARHGARCLRELSWERVARALAVSQADGRM